jgi:DNA-binding GntR family transcriptional regulator
MRIYINKADQVYDTLRSEFVRGEWSFGQTFSTHELAARFGVSVRPVREAVDRLQAAGFVDVIPHVGCRVVLPDETRVRNHLELSAILQGPATEMAADRATEADLDRLEQIHQRLVPVVEARDFTAYQTEHRKFHTVIFEIARNPALASLAEDAADLWEFYFHPYRHHWQMDLMQERLADHGRILQALRRREGDVARKEMEAHLDPDGAMKLMERFSEHADASAI